jgi:hypothetical protein
MNRRQLITLVGGAAAWPVLADAQQQVPVIGFVNAGSPATNAESLPAFRQGLGQTGIIPGSTTFSLRISASVSLCRRLAKAAGHFAAELLTH